jgi:exosortase/archaeosortase family protein
MNRIHPLPARAPMTLAPAGVRALLFALTVVALSSYFHHSILRFAWIHLDSALTGAIYYSLDALYGPGTLLKYTAQDALQIVHQNFTLRITQACSGLEGWFLFTLAALLVWAADRGRFSRKGWACFFVGGLVFVHLLNVARITALFELMAWSYTPQAFFGPEAVRDIVHPYAGIVFYVVGLIFYCAVIERCNAARPRYRLTAPRAIPTLFP